MTDLDAQYSEGIALHRMGRLNEAAATYDRILAAVPEHADALHMRGVVHMQQGQAGPAAELIGKSLALKPNQAQALNNYGLALIELRKIELAIILRSAGLGDWVAADADAYVAKAVEAARQPEPLDALRAGLRAQVENSTLFDSKAFAEDLEGAFRGMWRAWCRSA